MAEFTPSRPPAPIEISRFLGINESIGETEIQLGEATSQTNFRITQNYKPQKRLGHKTYINFGNALDVQGMWEGVIGAKDVLLVVNNGKIYEFGKGEL